MDDEFIPLKKYQSANQRDCQKEQVFRTFCQTIGYVFQNHILIVKQKSPRIDGRYKDLSAPTYFAQLVPEKKTAVIIGIKKKH
jgi:DNA modification methylase